MHNVGTGVLPLSLPCPGFRFPLPQGARRADVTEVSKGYASMGGTFKLTFKGHSTESISYNAGATDIQVQSVRNIVFCVR